MKTGKTSKTLKKGYLLQMVAELAIISSLRYLPQYLLLPANAVVIVGTGAVYALEFGI